MATKILLIDDDDDFSEIISGSIERKTNNQFKVTIANSEDKAWGIINSGETFDIFLVDLELIDVNSKLEGFAFAESLQKNEKTKSTPIIFISGPFTNSNDERITRLSKSFFGKPIDSERIIKKIEEILNIN